MEKEAEGCCRRRIKAVANSRRFDIVLAYIQCACTRGRGADMKHFWVRIALISHSPPHNRYILSDN